MLACRQWSELRFQCPGDGAQFERLDDGCSLAAVQTEIYQQIVYHPCHAPGGIMDGVCMAHAAVSLCVVQQQFGVAADGGQRGAQFVGDVLDEVTSQLD